MSDVAESERSEFFRAIEAAAKKAIWAAVATSSPSGARVRMVHPTWEGETLWFATGTSSPKVRQLEADARIDLQFQVAPPDFVHLRVRGNATIVEDEAEKKRRWDGIDYDRVQFWSGGPGDPEYTLVRVEPTRVALSKMFGSTDQRVWRAR